MEYLKKRLKQPTTWLGITSIVTTALTSVPVDIVTIVGQIAIAVGLIHIDEGVIKSGAK